MLSPRRYNEAVATLLTSTGSIRITPLGIYSEEDKLYANIYPGTSLYLHAEEAYEACILFPFSVEAFYHALGIGGPLHLRPAISIKTPCPNAPGIIVEATVARRERKGEKLGLELYPVSMYIEGKPQPYSRDYGCSIELLIALTRLQFWARHIRPINCTTINKLHLRALDSFECILHATWSEDVHRLAAEALRRSIHYSALSGC